MRAAHSEDPDFHAEAAVTVSAAPKVRFQGLVDPSGAAESGVGGVLPLIRSLMVRQMMDGR